MLEQVKTKVAQSIINLRNKKSYQLLSQTFRSFRNSASWSPVSQSDTQRNKELNSPTMRVVFLFVLHSIRTLHVTETFLLFQQHWAKLELQRDFGAVDSFVAALVAVSNLIPVNRKLMWEHGVLF
jgi:hypothetical protein